MSLEHFHFPGLSVSVETPKKILTPREFARKVKGMVVDLLQDLGFAAGVGYAAMQHLIQDDPPEIKHNDKGEVK